MPDEKDQEEQPIKPSLPGFDMGKLKEMMKGFGKEGFGIGGASFPKTTRARSGKDEMGMTGMITRSFFEKPAKDPVKEQFQEDMKSGKIPGILAESFRLVDAADPAAVAFQEKMTEITQRLFKGNYSAKLHNFRFVISADPSNLASILPEANPPIVVFGKDFIAKIDSEDKLAAALAHELTHQAIFDRIGKHDAGNTEETQADVWAVKLLQKAGYNPRAMTWVHQELKAAQKEAHPNYERTFLNAMSSVHPDWDIRIRNTELGYGYIEGKEKLNEGTTPLDASLKSQIAAVSHASYLGGIFADKKYESLGTSDKIAFIKKLLQDELLDIHPYYNARISDVSDAIRALHTEAKGHETELLDIAKIIVNADKPDDPINRQIRSYYTATVYAITGKEDRYPAPIGELETLKTEMQRFVDAKSKDEALAAAQNINRIAGEYKFGTSEILDGFGWPSFNHSVPSKEGINGQIATSGKAQFPWTRHLNWALEQGEGSAELKAALSRFNIDDQRWRPTGVATVVPRNVNWIPLGYHQGELEIGPDGSIGGFKGSTRDRFRDKGSYAIRADEEKIMSQRDSQAEQLSKSIDWKELESDFFGFVEKHREQLTPQITLVEGGQRFAEEFMQRTKALYAREPEKYKPILQKFFTGFDANQQEQTPKPKKKDLPFWERLGVGARENEPDPNSIPGMIQEFRIKYGVPTGMQDLNQLREMTRGGGAMGMGMMRSFGDRKPVADFAQFGMSLAHPFAKFALEAPEELLSPKDRMGILKSTRYRAAYGVRNPEQFVGFDTRKVLRYEQPKNPESFMRTLEHLKSLNGDGSETIKDIEQIELYSYLQQRNGERLDFNKVAALVPVSFLGQNYGFSEDEHKYHRRQLRELVEVQMKNNAKVELTNAITVEDLVSSYQYYAQDFNYGGPLFTRHPRLQKQYEAKIKERVDTLEEPAKKLELVEKLLFDTDLRNPEFRKWALDNWVKTQGQLIGLDDKTADYQTEFDAITKKVIEKARLGQGAFMLTALLDEVQAQETLSFDIKEKLINIYLKKGSEANLLSSANDYLMENVGNHPQLRMATLEFLTSPVTDRSCKSMLTEVQRAGKGHGGLIQFLQEQYDNNGLPIPEEAKIAKLTELHKNFWSLPFAARTVYLERILFPVKETKPEAFQRATEFVLQQVLPPDKPFAKEARKILTAHLEDCSVPLQRIIFSALTTACERREEDGHELRPGQVLSLVLGRTGAAGAKILQAIHSYLSSVTIDDNPNLEQFRDDLKASKSAYDLPLRWQVFERINEVVAPEDKAGITYVEECLGAGAYGYAMKIKRGDDRSALTLLKPGAESEAKYQFEKYRVTAQKLAKEEPRWEPLIGILEHARGMSDIECDFNIAAQQIQIAGGLYDGLKVKADGHEFTIDSASLLSYGKEYKETNLAKGVHFNDLPEKSPKEIAFKKAAAKVLFSTELYLVLKGGKFDHDRHGAQQRISVEDHHITMFDHGAMALRDPSEREKQTLASLIADSYKEGKRTKAPVIEVLIKKLTDTRPFGKEANYLDTFKRGILALGDYRRYMTDEEVQQSIVAAFKTGAVDKTFISTISGALSGSDMSDLQQSGSKTGIVIDDPRIGMGTRTAVKAYTALHKVKGWFSSGKKSTNASTTPMEEEKKPSARIDKKDGENLPKPPSDDDFGAISLAASATQKPRYITDHLEKGRTQQGNYTDNVRYRPVDDPIALVEDREERSSQVSLR